MLDLGLDFGERGIEDAATLITGGATSEVKAKAANQYS